ncbi:translational activator [Nesidiocoris tenuis]|uniref:Translational activator n=1 Tax=Nesidiocoris tenuis TaxID=355587 RepID=A0ABN7B0X7_9HEMI|nr:translational activator [Nesidiocoris tenuis]
MSSEDVVKVLKDLPLKVQTSSLASRKEVFTDVQAILPNPALNEPVVRGICKVIQLAVSRYRDSVSQKFLLNIVSSLSEIHPDWTIKHLTPVISNLASANSSIIATKSTAQECIHVLSWSCCLVTNAYSKSNSENKKEFQDVCESQAILLSCIFAAEHSKKIAKAYNVLQSQWNYNPDIIVPLYKETIFVIPESLHNIVFGATLLKHVYETKKLEHVATLKPHLLGKFVKIVVGSKTKVPTYVVDACHPMLILVDHNEFSGFILPAIQKAMLRNPELILQVLPNLLSNLSLDLSQYTDAITKSVAGSLCSNDEESRIKAAEAMKALSLQCSDSNAIWCTSDLLFKRLGGSQGKITVADHKIAILQALGNLSFNSIAGSSIQLISAKIVEQFIYVLETEVHEKTLLHCVEMLGLWCTKFTREIPQQLVKWIDTCQTLKQFTPFVRAAYFSALADCCNFLTAPQLQTHVNSLLKVVEKAAAQPLQMGLLREALAATCLLLKMASTHAYEMDLSSVYIIILDMDKQLFLSDKFLSQSSPEALCQVVWLCEVILLEHASNLLGGVGPINRALVLSLINGRSAKSQIHAILQRLFSSLQGTSIAVALLDQITEMLIGNRLQWSTPPKENSEAIDVSGCTEVKPRELVEAITTICSGSNLSWDDRQLLALRSVLACYHPFVGYGPSLSAEISQIIVAGCSTS